MWDESALFGLHSVEHAPGNRLNLVRRHQVGKLGIRQRLANLLQRLSCVWLQGLWEGWLESRNKLGVK